MPIDWNIYSRVNLAVNLYRTYWTGIINLIYVAMAEFSFSWSLFNPRHMIKSVKPCETVKDTKTTGG